MTMVCVVAGVYYLQHVGLLGFVFARFRRGGGAAQNNVVRHRNPDGNEEEKEEAPPPPPTLSKVELMQRFLVGICASLWPTWDHRNLYPPVEVRQ